MDANGVDFEARLEHYSFALTGNYGLNSLSGDALSSAYLRQQLRAYKLRITRRTDYACIHKVRFNFRPATYRSQHAACTTRHENSASSGSGQCRHGAGDGCPTGVNSQVSVKSLQNYETKLEQAATRSTGKTKECRGIRKLTKQRRCSCVDV